jgi:hypothetical protein
VDEINRPLAIAWQQVVRKARDVPVALLFARMATAGI